MSADIATAFQRAVRLHKGGKLAQAEQAYRAVLQRAPDHAEAKHNLGVLIVGSQGPDAALPWLLAALRASPTQAQYWISYIEVLIRVGQGERARAVLKEGRRHGLRGAAVDALAARLPPAAAADGDGDVDRRLGDDPASARACAEAGARLAREQRFAEAERAYRAALAIDEGLASVHDQLGATLLALGRLEEAEAACRQATLLRPELLQAHGNLALILRSQGRLEEAEASARRAVALAPRHVATHANLGAILIDRRRMREAEASCREAIALRPQHVEAHLNLGVALMGQGRFTEAVASYRQVLSLEPGFAEAHSNLLYAMNFMPEVSAAQALEEAIRYGQVQRQGVRQVRRAWRAEENPQRLRVGFVSGDLRSHPVGYFLQGLLRGLHGARLELVAYPTNSLEDALTTQLQQGFDGWKPIWMHDDETAARIIHDDGVHLLVDLAGHTAHNRLPLFLRKPAPVQLAWLGYFASTGLREIDYVLGDPQVTPAAEEDHFVEQVWRLPETYFCFSPPDFDLPVTPLPALDKGVLTFGCFNSMAKVNDGTLSLWARVLEAVPGSRLFLKAGQFAEPGTVAALLERAQRLGIDAQRLLLEGPSPREEYLQAYARVDVALDPFPFPGGTTSAEGLWMGVPVLTLRGSRFIGHNGRTIACNAGLADWVAEDEDDYVARARRLTSELAALARLRQGLRAQLLASPLFDSRRFARHFEEALWAMWSRRAQARSAQGAGS